MFIKRNFSKETSIDNCFDFLRLLFAFSVFCWHFQVLTSIPIYWPISSAMGVGGFFIISGFLITKSFYRSNDIFDYTLKRIKRIVPAYFLVVVFCAFSFSLISSLNIIDYFSSIDFFKYLLANLTFLNFIHPTLPGVFEFNEMPFVNGSLWTIKVELFLYAIVPFMAFFIKKRPFILFGIFYLVSFLFVSTMDYLYNKSGNEIYEILSRQFLGQGNFFISGVIILFYYDWFLKQRKWLVPFSLFVFLIRYFVTSFIIGFLFPFSFAVLIIYFAYTFKSLKVASKFGDLSYGFYLFHFPVIQFLVYLGWFKNNPIILFLFSLVLISFLSFLSWHLLEKHFLKR